MAGLSSALEQRRREFGTPLSVLGVHLPRRDIADVGAQMKGAFAAVLNRFAQSKELVDSAPRVDHSRLAIEDAEVTERRCVVTLKCLDVKITSDLEPGAGEGCGAQLRIGETAEIRRQRSLPEGGRRGGEGTLLGNVLLQIVIEVASVRVRSDAVGVQDGRQRRAHAMAGFSCPGECGCCPVADEFHACVRGQVAGCCCGEGAHWNGFAHSESAEVSCCGHQGFAGVVAAAVAVHEFYGGGQRLGQLLGTTGAVYRLHPLRVGDPALEVIELAVGEGVGDGDAVAGLKKRPAPSKAVLPLGGRGGAGEHFVVAGPDGDHDRQVAHGIFERQEQSGGLLAVPIGKDSAVGVVEPNDGSWSDQPLCCRLPEAVS
ncbi:hypothetical protein [Streptomyces sp. NPDC048111]|uniref:hypothetical protein n=1 Tax=Streptomyces sp. NPDC048111 TaxID=3365500 RepID=UPI00370FBDAF